MKKIICTAIISIISACAFAAGDWASFGRYAEANKSVKTPPLAVLMGDSITDAWVKSTPSDFFKKITLWAAG